MLQAIVFITFCVLAEGAVVIQPVDAPAKETHQDDASPIADPPNVALPKPPEFINPYAAILPILQSSANALAQQELDRFNTVELIYRSQVRHFQYTESAMPIGSVYLKMYRDYTDYKINDIYRSDSVMFPFSCEIQYNCKVMTTPARTSQIPGAEQAAQNDLQFAELAQSSSIRRYRCNPEGVFLQDGLPHVPPILDFYELTSDDQMTALPTQEGARPNTLTPRALLTRALLPKYTPKRDDRGLILNGSFNAWRSDSAMPKYFNCGRLTTFTPEHSIIQRFPGKSKGTGYAVQQTWYKADANELWTSQFGTLVEDGFHPNTLYEIKVKARNLSGLPIYITAWQVDRNRTAHKIAKHVLEIPPGPHDEMDTYTAQFKTLDRSLMSIRFASYIRSNKNMPATVIWDDWTVRKAPPPRPTRRSRANTPAPAD